MREIVTTWYLEATDPRTLRPARPAPGFVARQAVVPCPEINRFFYGVVGAAWSWHDRLGWTRADWLRYVQRSELETWIGYHRDTPAGYFELRAGRAGQHTHQNQQS
ncbi:MAG: hypothetical protein HC846_04530 [Blastocatellia bacterium]|nr:hypothetical protein [Blastocatellia bacterium]